MKKTILALSILVLLSISCKAEPEVANPTTFGDLGGHYATRDGTYVLLLDGSKEKANLTLPSESGRSVNYDATALAPTGTSLSLPHASNPGTNPNIIITFRGLNQALSKSEGVEEDDDHDKTLTKVRDNTTFEEREGTYTGGSHRLVLDDGTATFTPSSGGSEEVTYTSRTLAPAYQLLGFSTHSVVFSVTGHAEYTVNNNTTILVKQVMP